MDSPFFINGKLVGLQVNNPQIYRLNNFTHIINSDSIEIPKDRKPDLVNIVFNCIKVMAKLEMLLLKYQGIKNSTVKKLEKGQYKKSYNSIEWEDPTFELHDCFSEFLIQASIALRYKTRFSMIIFNTNELKDHKKRNKRILDELNLKKSIIGEEYHKCCLDMINDDINWLKELIDFRNQTEHVEDEMLDITDFKLITHDKDIQGAVFPGLTLNKKFVHTYMEETFYNVFTHIEDFFAMLLNLFCNGPLRVIKVLNQEDNCKKGSINDLGDYSYELMIKDDILKSILSNIEQDQKE